MITNHTEAVRWHILKDSDGRVLITSDKGVKLAFDNPDAAKVGFESLVTNTMDVVKALLDRDMSTIKFYIEF